MQRNGSVSNSYRILSATDRDPLSTRSRLRMMLTKRLGCTRARNDDVTKSGTTWHGHDWLGSKAEEKCRWKSATLTPNQGAVVLNQRTGNPRGGARRTQTCWRPLLVRSLRGTPYTCLALFGRPKDAPFITAGPRPLWRNIILNICL